MRERAKRGRETTDTMQFDPACERTNGHDDGSVQRLSDVTHRILRRESDMRTDNLASRHTKINNARSISLSFSIYISLSLRQVKLLARTLVTYSYIVLVSDGGVLLAHGGCYGGVETPECESLRCATRHAKRFSAETR